MLIIGNAIFKSLFNSEKLHLPGIFNNAYLPALEGLRGVAILGVIIGHISINTPWAKLDFGDIGVDIFFVLSGFLITSLLFKEKIRKGSVSLKNFYIRRALRILPVAYLFLLVLLCLDRLFKLNLSTGSYLAAAFYVKNIHLHYIANWYNGHFWTLSVEEQFYIIFPLMIIFSLKSYVRIIFIIILSIPLLLFLGFHNIGIFYSNYVVHELTYLFIDLFQAGTVSILIGSLLSVLLFKQLLPSGRLINTRYAGLMIFLAALAVRIIFSWLLITNYCLVIFFAIMIALVIYIVLHNKYDYLGLLLTNKWLIRLGLLSYSLYIWQQIFLYDQPWANAFNYAGSLYLNIPVLFIVAYVSYNFYELKFLKLKNKFK